MKTPICDFVRSYAGKDALRLHMPGHKGQGPLGTEILDITEISGADVLYAGTGIIAESESIASGLFGSGRTLYSTEGSSLSIRAMTDLALRYAAMTGLAPRILAARNAHRAFLSAAALLDADVEWIYPKESASLLACPVSADVLEEALSRSDPTPCAVYITSPDYPGHLQDIASLAEVCHAHGSLLLVDNAHGAYLRFLPQPVHPLDLGADIVCDSAHKTLPVLTGGAYLHLSSRLPEDLADCAEASMQLFASTSPSYLIMQSLDAANPYLADTLPGLLRTFLPLLDGAKQSLVSHGYRLLEDEPLKVTLDAKAYGYTGDELYGMLEKEGLVCEFSDPDYLVMMLSPSWGRDELDRIVSALLSVPRREALRIPAPAAPRPDKALSVRQAMLALSEEIPVRGSLGRVLASARFTCPPAVPIAIPGERLDADAVRAFEYYGIDRCRVVIEDKSVSA